VSSVLELLSRSPQQTRDLGRALGETFCGGEVVELCGPLGAGKTQLAKGLALGLGVPNDEPVVSPSFVLVREYLGRLTFYHCDAYRLQTADELLMLGLEEMLGERNCVVALEWADRFPGALGADTIRVDLEHEGDSSRRVRISVPGEARAAELARRLGERGYDGDPPP